MTTTPFLRRIRVEAGGPPAVWTVDNLRIVFAIHQDVQGKTPPSFIKIYNLSDIHAAEAAERWAYVVLRAGYGDQSPMNVIYSGEITKPVQGVEGLDRVFKMLVGGAETQKTLAGFNQSYPGPTELLTIISDIVASMGLALGPTTVIPTATVSDFAFSGKATQALDLVLANRQISWHERDGTVFFFAAQDDISNQPTITIDRERGMVGHPTRTDNGIKLKVLLSNAITLGQVIIVGSIIQSLNGQYKVTKLSHLGDNWLGDFITDIEAVHI